MFGSFDISTSALTAQRIRLETISSNIANIDSIRGADGSNTPYRRLFTVFRAQAVGGQGGMGVQVEKIAADPSDFKKKYEPNSELADEQGFVRYPNVDLSTEYVNALETTRAYEANITAIETTKSMLASTLRVLA